MGDMLEHDREITPNSVEPVDLEKMHQALSLALLPSIGQTPLLVGPDGEQIELPPEIHRVLALIVDHLRDGDGVMVVPRHAELTALEAAEILNVSRPFVQRLIDSGKLPCQKKRALRQLKLSDVLAYRDEMDRVAEEVAQEMVADAEAYGLYDDL